MLFNVLFYLFLGFLIYVNFRKNVIKDLNTNEFESTSVKHYIKKDM